MSLFAGLEEIVKAHEPLGPYTWFGIGGPAEYLITPQSEQQLQEVVRRCRENEISMRVLGGGANLLIDDAGVEGAVIHLGGEFGQVEVLADGVRAGAAADMGRLVLRCIREGLSGLEGLTGVPGTIGGCVRMNAGGSFGDVGSTIQSVRVMTDEGEQFTRHRDDLSFGYRNSNITSKFILDATFGLTPDEPSRVLRQVKQIWIYKKNTQPLGRSNAGCVFKNPRGLSAGALIDNAGLKGRRIGGAHISEKHGNFIVADPGGTAADVLKLINVIRDAVYEKAGVYLELEIEVW
ncbi:MAG: UDP-N-acetylmuramate dehydrogenase [Planctomycetota bacterium]